MTAVCPMCQIDRTPLPAGARFCPHCGGALPDEAATIGSHLISGALNSGTYSVARDAPEFPSGESRSAILRGFANALYRLGWRYESGVGAWRNEAEAHRCYGKSAKLGNAAAAARVREPDSLTTSEWER